MNDTLKTIFNTNQYEQFFGQYGWLIVVAIIWSVVWKGMALWHSARNSQRGWFIALLVINTVGILEIIYLTAFRKSKLG